MAELTIEVPDELAVEVAAAVRARYGEIVRTAYPDGGETDAQAWRAFAAWVTASLLADDYADRARRAAQDQVDVAVTARDTAERQARGHAWGLVRSVLMVPTPGTPPTDGPPTEGV